MATSSVKAETLKHNDVVRVKQRKNKQEMTGNCCHRYEQTVSGVAPERKSSGSASSEPKEGLADTRSSSAPKTKPSTEICQLVEGKKTASKDGILEAAASIGILSRVPGDGSTPSLRTSDKGELNRQTEEVLKSMTDLKISDKENEPVTKSSVERQGATETWETQLQKLSPDKTPQLLERGKSKRTSDNNKETRQPKPYRASGVQSHYKNVKPSPTLGVATGNSMDEFLHSVVYDRTVKQTPADYPAGNTINDLNNPQPTADAQTSQFERFVDTWLDNLDNYPDNNNNGQLQDPNAKYILSMPPNITMDSGQQQFGQVPAITQGQAMVWNSHQNVSTLTPLGVQSVPPGYAVYSVSQYPVTVSPVQSNPVQQAVTCDQVYWQPVCLPSANPTQAVAYGPLPNQNVHGINNNNQPAIVSSSAVSSAAKSPPIAITGHNCGIVNNRTENNGVSDMPLKSNHNHSSEQQVQTVRHDSVSGNIPIFEEIVNDETEKNKSKKTKKVGNREKRKPSNKLSTVKKERKTKSPKKSSDPVDSSLSSISGDAEHPNMSATSVLNSNMSLTKNSVQFPSGSTGTNHAYEDAMCVVAEDFQSKKSPQITSSPENVMQELLQNPDILDDLVRLVDASDNPVTSALSDVTQQHQNSPAGALPTANALPHSIPSTMIPQTTTVTQQQQFSRQYQHAALDADLLQQSSVPVFSPQQTTYVNSGQATQITERGHHASGSMTHVISPMPIHQQMPYSATVQDMVQPQIHMSPNSIYQASQDQSTSMLQPPHVQVMHQTAHMSQYSASATATASVQMNGYPQMTQRSMSAQPQSTEPGTMTVISVTSQTTVQTEPTQNQRSAPSSGGKRDTQCLTNLGLYNIITKAGFSGKPVNPSSIEDIMKNFVPILPKETL